MRWPIRGLGASPWRLRGVGGPPGKALVRLAVLIAGVSVALTLAAPPSSANTTAFDLHTAPPTSPGSWATPLWLGGSPTVPKE